VSGEDLGLVIHEYSLTCKNYWLAPSNFDDDTAIARWILMVQNISDRMSCMELSMEPRYRTTVQILHWLIALAVIGLIVAGLILKYDLAPKPLRPALRMLHIGTGLTVLALMIVRLVLRLIHRPPPLPATVPTRERIASTAAHWLFYAAVLAMPVFGVLFVQAYGKPVGWFGLVVLPQLVGKNAAIGALFYALHFYVGLGLLALIVLHVSAVIRHEKRGERLLIRMMPRRQG
jgi:cytochrome b561